MKALQTCIRTVSKMHETFSNIVCECHMKGIRHVYERGSKYKHERYLKGIQRILVGFNICEMISNMRKCIETFVKAFQTYIRKGFKNMRNAFKHHLRISYESGTKGTRKDTKGT